MFRVDPFVYLSTVFDEITCRVWAWTQKEAIRFWILLLILNRLGFFTIRSLRDRAYPI